VIVVNAADFVAALVLRAPVVRSADDPDRA
jgi:hypothetical protein